MKKSVQFDKPTAASKKEEKKLEKELKRIAKEENQLRDHLIREKNFSKESNLRGWADWESWCKGVKIDELRNDLTAVSQSVSQLIDRTNHTVKTIQMHRVHAEEQYLRNFQNHSELIDYVMEIFKIFQNSTQQMYETDREQLIAFFYAEGLARQTSLQERKLGYENFAHASVSLTKSRIQKGIEHFIELNVETEAASIVRRGELTAQAKKRESMACWEIRNLINLINNQMWPKNRIDEYQNTLKKSEEVDKVIEDLDHKIDSSVKVAAKQDEVLQNVDREHNIKIAELKAEQQFMTKMMKQMEEKIRSEKSIDQEKLVQLVLVYEETKNCLKKNFHQGKTLEFAMKICLKFEKLSDKLESSESSVDYGNQSPVDAFHEKLSRVEAQCVMLRDYKTKTINQNINLENEVKEKTIEFQVNQNLLMLRLGSTQSVGEICQISHQISQIKMPITLSKRYKLCKACRNHFK